jgi:uncharacterized OB-fold protein
MAGVRFWREFDTRYRMQATRCPSCDLIYFPPRPVCRKCRRSSVGKMEKVPLPVKGTIASYTVVHQGQKGFDAQVPYVIAIVEFEGGVTILGQVVDCDPEDVDIGMEVKPVFRRVREEGEAGVIHYGYKFAPPCFPTCKDDGPDSEDE